jgi:hypothetical protein
MLTPPPRSRRLKPEVAVAVCVLGLGFPRTAAADEPDEPAATVEAP